MIKKIIMSKFEHKNIFYYILLATGHGFVQV
jgi:hypothetical protein